MSTFRDFLCVLRPSIHLGFLLIALFAPTRGAAQTGVGDIVYTVGTVTRDSFNRDWAYILWQATEPGLISNRVFAVYSKPGDATNPVPYVRQSVVMVQTDARVIEPLLRRAENLGDDQNKLQDDLQQVFGNLMPSNIISRSERLSAVIRGSLNDSRYYQNLLLLARNHAGINLVLGFADAELIPSGRTTFEVRAYDMKTDKDLAVIGRVTVQAGSPTILPPPGSPVLVPEYSAMGDLNLKFRWGTPDELRRLSLMQFGYNLYRVEKSFAAGNGWSAVVRPPLSNLLALVTNSPMVARRVNRVPITPGKLFTVAESLNVAPPTGDTNTSFVMDDDRRGRPGYINYGFTNGAQFYYYVAARDVLGRDGDLSFGLLATVCDKLPPMPPRTVHVLNDYSYNTTTMKSNQFLRVVWRQSPNTNDSTTNYWIYRWTNINEMHLLSGGISNNLIGIVPHVSNAVYNSYLDMGPTSPGVSPSDYGKTYWYTVRAGDSGACGQNLSGPGGPAYGVLRDRIGPGPGSGIIEINCLRPLVRFRNAGFVTSNSLDNAVLPFYLTCSRIDPRFEWAEFVATITYTGIGTGTNFTTTNEWRRYFLGDDMVSTWWMPPRSPDGGQYSYNVSVKCRAGLFGGKISSYTFAAIPGLPLDRNYEFVNFEAFTQTFRVIAGDRKDQDCREHQPPGGGDPGGTNDIVVSWLPSPGSYEYRVYRRVDDGPLSLICQGAVTNVQPCIDNNPPVNGGTICYYLQLLDQHGNPSPMTPLGCIDTAPKSPLATPTLAKITPTGDLMNPGMNISWFCPPYGVDRFEVRIAGLPTAQPTNNLGFADELVFTGEPGASMTFSNFGTNLTLTFFPAITPKVGPGFGNNGPTFIVGAVPVIGKTYVMTVRALGKNGNAGDFSNFETFVWNATNVFTPQVPWPARPLPSTNANFVALAFFLSPTNANELFRSAGQTGNGVLIGADQLPNRTINTRQGQATIGGPYDPNTGLLSNALGQTIFPLAMYRYQTPNANFPAVSGDVIQVSPLMEVIAYQLQAGPTTTNTIVQDPFIASTSVTDLHDIFFWLRDTQPQISGARYRYVLVRFKPENHEIDQLILSNEVDVP